MTSRMPRVLRLTDDPDTGWPKVEGLRVPVPADHPFGRHGVTELMALPAVTGLRRWLALAAEADVVHAYGPAAVRAGYLLSHFPRLAGPPGRQQFAAAGADGLPDRLKLVAAGADRPGTGLPGWLTRRALRAADRVVAATHVEVAQYRALGVQAEHIEVIPPGVPPAPSPPNPTEFRRSLDIPAGARLVIAAGGFNRTAGMRSAVWAFDVIRYTTPDVYLVLVGDGPERKRTERFARGLAFDDYRVRFAGARSDVPALLGLAEVVLVTHSRGGANLALEAMAAGRPVVAARTPDLAEVVEDGVTGRLVPPEDRVGMAAATRELLSDPSLAARFGEAGRARVAERHSVAEMTDRYSLLYKRMLSG
jgi:glycosyltransferase involved in cell wall biosynthesis